MDMKIYAIVAVVVAIIAVAVVLYTAHRLGKRKFQN